MKNILLITLIVGLLSCSQTKKDDSRKTTNENLVERKVDFKYPISVEYSETTKKSGFPDTMYFNLNNERILLLPNGKAFNQKNSLVFDLKLENEIHYIYFQEYYSDLIAIFVETDMDASTGQAKRISLNSDSIKWSISFGGFNMERPVIIDNFAYISTIGFIGKLDMNSGNFIWKFDDLYENDKYANFDEPKFLENNRILFLSKSYGKNYADTIIIDDNEGKILKKN